MSLLSLRPGFPIPCLIMTFCLTVTQFIVKISSLVVVVYISSSFLYSQSDPDVLTVKLFLPFPIVICAVYIPPSDTVDLQDSLLLYLRGIYTSSYVPVVVLGDFNCPDIEWSLLRTSSRF